MGTTTEVVTFATESHRKVQDEFIHTYAKYFNLMFSISDLSGSDFYKENDIFKFKKYYGFFLWKPFLIDTVLDSTPCDTVLYCDSNLRFTDINKFLKIYNEWFAKGNHIFIAKYPHYINKDWTKRDCFVLMDADEPRYWEAKQVWSVIIGFDNSDFSKMFVKEWLEYNRDKRIASDEENVCGLPNLDGYNAHRWDQSILSIMVEKYNLPCYPYLDLITCVDKIYPQEILDKKSIIDRDPLQKES